MRILRSQVNTLTQRTIGAEPWRFLCCYSKQAVEQIVKMLMSLSPERQCDVPLMIPTFSLIFVPSFNKTNRTPFRRNICAWKWKCNVTCKLITTPMCENRYVRNPAGQQQHSALCNNGIEDEFHFLLECPVYSSTRKQLIKRNYWNRPSMSKLVQLFNSKRRKEIITLAKYVYQAFKLRRELIAVNWNVLICKVLVCVHWVFRNYHCAMLCLCAINVSVKLAFVCRFCCLCIRLYGPVALKQLIKILKSWILNYCRQAFPNCNRP